MVKIIRSMTKLYALEKQEKTRVRYLVISLFNKYIIKNCKMYILIKIINLKIIKFINNKDIIITIYLLQYVSG